MVASGPMTSAADHLVSKPEAASRSQVLVVGRPPGVLVLTAHAIPLTNFLHYPTKNKVLTHTTTLKGSEISLLAERL